MHQSTPQRRKSAPGTVCATPFRSKTIGWCLSRLGARDAEPAAISAWNHNKLIRSSKHQGVEEASGNPDTGKNPGAVALGKLGGAKGSKARAEPLSPARRKAIAKKAAKARRAAGASIAGPARSSAFVRDCGWVARASPYLIAMS